MCDPYFKYNRFSILEFWHISTYSLKYYEKMQENKRQEQETSLEFTVDLPKEYIYHVFPCRRLQRTGSHLRKNSRTQTKISTRSSSMKTNTTKTFTLSRVLSSESVSISRIDLSLSFNSRPNSTRSMLLR